MRLLKSAEIKKTRERLDMSQAEFATAFHLSVKTLQGWEAGRLTPSGAASVLLFLISVIPGPILKALGGKNPTGRSPG